MAKAQTKRAATNRETRDFSVKANLRKAADGVAGRLRAYRQKYIVTPYENGKTLAADFRKAPRKTIDTVVEDGKTLVGDVKEQALEKIDEYTAGGRKFFTRLPLARKLDTRVSGLLQAIPARVNLPSKAEIKRLTRTVDALNRKMDVLNKNCSA